MKSLDPAFDADGNVRGVSVQLDVPANFPSDYAGLILFELQIRSNAGGDGIYGAWSVPYLEPMMKERRYIDRYPEIYSSIYYNEGDCPVAEEVQKQLMQFKTNYRDLKLAKEKAEILRKVIRKLIRNK